MILPTLSSDICKPCDLSARLLIMRFIHLAMVAGVVMFGVVLFMISGGQISRTPAFQDSICQTAIVLSGTTVLLAANLHRLFFRSATAQANLTTAIRRYSVYFMIRASIIESGALFAAVVTFMTHNILPFGLLAFGAAALAFYRPSRAEFERLLGGSNRLCQEWQ